jgi:hypothetical protein
MPPSSRTGDYDRLWLQGLYMLTMPYGWHDCSGLQLKLNLYSAHLEDRNRRCVVVEMLCKYREAESVGSRAPCKSQRKSDVFTMRAASACFCRLCSVTGCSWHQFMLSLPRYLMLRMLHFDTALMVRKQEGNVWPSKPFPGRLANQCIAHLSYPKKHNQSSIL